MICYANDTVQRTTAAVLVATCNALAGRRWVFQNSRNNKKPHNLLFYKKRYLFEIIGNNNGRHPTQRIHAEPVSYVPGTTSYPG